MSCALEVHCTALYKLSCCYVDVEYNVCVFRYWLCYATTDTDTDSWNFLWYRYRYECISSNASLVYTLCCISVFNHCCFFCTLLTPPSDWSARSSIFCQALCIPLFFPSLFDKEEDIILLVIHGQIWYFLYVVKWLTDLCQVSIHHTYTQIYNFSLIFFIAVYRVALRPLQVFHRTYKAIIV